MMLELNRLAALYLQLHSKGDVENADKIKQLVEKVRKKEFIIGFCGHFSAGKSTMMNQLMEKEVLPSSPIPTSANVVKIKKGESYARIFYKEGTPAEFPAPYDYEIVKNFCKDGETIESLEISDEAIALPLGVSIMDTPGIDSTDESHRISTESALHLADIVLYVMDYNHVQSEQNFVFTKTLKDRNKPVYLVINMIDKHNEEELSFQDYKRSVKAAFQSWGVDPDGMYFTSLKDFDHPENQYVELKQFLTEQMNHKDELLLHNAIQASIPIIEDHLYYVDKDHEDLKNSYETQLHSLSENDRKRVLDEVLELEERQAYLLNVKENGKQQFEDGLKNILDNAYLMPAATRDLAHSYIESCQYDFKVGFFFSRKKTEEEQQARLIAFYESFKKQASAQLDWHIKDFIIKFFKENGVEASEFFDSVYQDITVEFEPLLLQSLVKKGAGFTGEYILNYTNDVSNEIKRLYKKNSITKFEEGNRLLEEVIHEELTKVEHHLKKYNQFKVALNGLKELSQSRRELQEALNQLLFNPLDPKVIQETSQWLKQFDNNEYRFEVRQMDVEKTESSNEKQPLLDLKYNEANERLKEEATVRFNVKDRLRKTVDKLNTTIHALDGIKGMHTLVNDMKMKAERLENNRFTIALFGAFSAGKSSFANALIGEKLLPVSPNPTTATINKILPSSEDHPHGTVLVKLKTNEQIFKDVEQSLDLFQNSCQTMEEALSIIDTLSYDRNEAKEKPHYVFLKAVREGYHTILNDLGQVLTVDMKDFEDYVAKEEKSCFVEWIEVYYDCPLTEQGITLVDTPGADSINARHTGVAFNYIKNADAILFVTYYNHAFSKADREFLIQLGRVKEAFEMDKMFFIVNASDLANSEEELKIVVDYVGDELKKYGFRFPRIYPLSSKQALEEKLKRQDGHSKMANFEQAFYSFILNDLAQLAIQSAHEDLKRSISSLEHMIEAAQQSDEVKKRKREAGEKSKNQIVKKLQEKQFRVEQRSLTQEIEELIFYVGQRVFFRFHDFYNEAFNPSSLRDDGRDLKKTLQSCFDEFVKTIGFDLSQEMRATSLRIENYINKLLNETHSNVEEMIHAIDEHVQILPFEPQPFDTLSFENPLEKMSKESFQSALSMFKGPKSFFEQGGKIKMKEQLEDLIKQPIHSYLEEQVEQCKLFYENQLISHLQELILTITEEINDYYEGYFTALSETIDIEKMKTSKTKIESFL